jgi:hypothetical protein
MVQFWFVNAALKYGLGAGNGPVFVETRMLLTRTRFALLFGGMG